MNLKQLFAFLVMMCGVLSANAQLEDNAIDIASGDVKIIPFGSKTENLYNGIIPKYIENYSFDIYWLQK